MRQKRDPLAIVGIGCRMPGGISTPDQLWQMMSAGKDGVCEVPRDRWDWRRYFSEDLEAPGKIYVRSAGFLQQDIRQFDAEFFGISPVEAMSLDPQQRLLLETSWEAIDDAGLSLDRLSGSRTGVYMGGLTLDNMLTQMSSQNRQKIGPNSATSSTMTMLSNRLSYFLDLRGPSISIDTACSSSLVALHLASQAIWNNECDSALVGAVNVIFRPEFMVAMCKGHFLAPDGRSKSFDQRANGYGRGEGAGVIVVRPLAAALANHDRVYALVRATGCNQDGRTNGITVPNPEAQKSLILSVLDDAEVPARSIHYVEAHGTGTPVGDPIEAHAIGETLGKGRQNGARLIMGSVKANLGHLEAAAGMAGLIKLCMCYKYSAIPPQANLGEPNQAIPFEELGLRLPTALEPLPSEQNRIFFAINSFGYGGTNAHAILENPPAAVAPARREETSQPALLPVSARSESALRAMVAQYRETLAQAGDSWRDICATAGLRRTHHNLRVAFVGRTCHELIAQIDEWLSATASTGPQVRRLDGSPIKPVFVFSGMGPQWWGMGGQLFEEQPVFASSVMRADAAFQAVSGWSILEEMRRGKTTSRVTRTIYAQPANFVLQAGLFDLLKSWGVHPAAAMGHSVGEIASAYAAGVLSLEQAVRVSYFRSQIQAGAAGLGGMLAVGLSEDEALTLIAPFGTQVSIAAINGPKNITLAGETDALDVIASRLQVKSVFNRKLQVEVAYHSAFMDPLKSALIDSLADIDPSLPTLDLYSTVTGAPVTGRAYDGPYWARNVREPVRFMRALESSIADGHRLFLEVGPHPVLTSSIRESIARNKVDAEVVSTLVRETDEYKQLYHSLASMYAAGSNLNWAAINGRPNAILTLPSYPWQRETHWGEAEAAIEERVGSVASALPGRRLDMHEPVWERHINNKYLPYIDDHVVQKLVLLPGAAFVDAALSLQKETGRTGMPVAVEDLHFRQPLVLDHNKDVVLRTALELNSLRVSFYSTSQSQTSWTCHAEARLSQKLLTRPAPADLAGLRNRLGETCGVDALYSRLTKLGLEYGPYFRRITELRANDREVLSKLKAGDPIEGYDIEHVLHPTLLDGAFQSLLAAIRGAESGFVPASIGQVVVFDKIPDDLWCYGQIIREDDEAVVGDILLLDNQGNVLSTVRELRCAKIAAKGKADVIERLLFRPTWSQTPLDASKRRAGTWLIIAEGGFSCSTFAAQVAAGLRREGCDRVVPICVPTPEAEGDTASDITPEQAVRTPADWKHLLESYPPEGLSGIAYITRHAGPDNPEAAIGHAGRLLELFRHLPASDSNLRVYLVTHRAQAVETGDQVDGFLQASAAGFFRVAHNEYPALTCSMIDRDGGDAAQVVAELLADDEADDIALRAGVRYTQRIEACTLLALESADLARNAVTPPNNGRYILASTVSGLAATADPHRDQLYWKQDTSHEPADDEIEIEVAYSREHVEGNGRRGVTSHELTRPKLREFSGRISRVGSSVNSWLPGEPIAAAALCRITSHVVVRETDLRAIKLDAAPSIGSASLAITAATVRAALQEMARAKPGETVLVISDAQDEVAEIFAVTAKTLGLDLMAARTGENADDGPLDQAPMDLRSDDFERRVLAANSGRPLDIIVFCGKVNSALHNRIPLAFGGRVVLYGPASESVDPNSFVDSATMYSLHRVNPTSFVDAGPLYRAALSNLRNSTGSAVAPDRLYSCDDLPRASLDNIGDSRTLTFDMTALPNVVPIHVGQVMIDPEAAYVVTGGFGGFGMVITDHLVAQGARQVVLIGRSGATTDRAKRQIADWRARGVTIHEALIDIANLYAINKFFAGLAAQRPVKGIMHAAGVLDDIPIREMTADKLIRVMRPKVQGAWNLHTCSLTHKLPLGHFVLFSSVSALIGNRGQANYVAANAVLDSLAAYRRARGLPATSINWGALGEVGMATEEDLRRQFELMGLTPFSPDVAMSALTSTLRFQPAQIGIMDVNWVQWGKFEPMGGKSLRFAQLTGARNGGLNASVSDSLRHLGEEERLDIVELMLAEKIAQTLRIPAERIDVKQSLTDMGVDSLMAVQLQIAVNMAFGVEFSAFELTRGANIRQLTLPLLERMGLSTCADVSRPGQNHQANRVSGPDKFSDAEVETLMVLPQLPSNVAAQQLAL